MSSSIWLVKFCGPDASGVVTLVATCVGLEGSNRISSVECCSVGLAGISSSERG